MIIKHGWKLLGVVILIYTFIVGLLVPLKSGILEVSPQSVQPGRNISFRVLGYNTHYLSGEIRAWLKMDEEYTLASSQILIQNDRELKVIFGIPRFLPTADKVQDFTLLLDNEVDGAHLLPSAVFVTQDSINPAMGRLEWPPERITDLHEKEGITFPFRNILAETIRNTYFHVPMWFAMIFLFLGAVFYSGRYLRSKRSVDDFRAFTMIRVGVLFGIMGLLTGAVWAKNTWGAYWSGDIKQNMTAICLLIYMAYFVLRQAYEDPDQRARIASVYALFAFAAMIPLLFVIPRLTDSLHPGNGGNPALGGEDLDNTMRMVFYPAIIGWFLLGLWMAQLSFRIERLKERLLENED
ncbi:MAG: cytochrome c biogenesis protein CcsA [Saprospirales bacterium]|nr:cytochrome c biogenesis protein CcsA [Saprospirales bacterium]MBK8492343.1 cytochrome c biogenesis protein CcsA [Saprospirales bacterium]